MRVRWYWYAVGALLVGIIPPAHAEDYDAYDIGGQYGWTDPTSSPTDQAQTIRTQGRCAVGTGQMTFVGPDGAIHAGPINVPQEWRFEDGYTLRIPAGLPMGNDYTVVVQCADMNRIDIAYGITEPGTQPYRIRYSNSPPPADHQPPKPSTATTTTPTPEPASIIEERLPTDTPLAPRDVASTAMAQPVATTAATALPPDVVDAPDTSVVAAHRPRHGRSAPSGTHSRPWLLWAGIAVPAGLLGLAILRMHHRYRNTP